MQLSHDMKWTCDMTAPYWMLKRWIVWFLSMDFIWLFGSIMSGWASCAALFSSSSFLLFIWGFYSKAFLVSAFLIEALVAYRVFLDHFLMICLLSITFWSFNTYISMHLIFMALQPMYRKPSINHKRNKTTNPSSMWTKTQVHQQRQLASTTAKPLQSTY